MQISILGIGETKAEYLKSGEAEYLRRLRHYCPVSYEWIRCVKTGKKIQTSQLIQDESRLLMSKIKNQDYIVVLDASGEQLTSSEFSQRLSDWMLQSRKKIHFVIGGANGLAPAVLNRADWVMSLSRMTFTHDMVRLFLFEQIYRAFTLLKGEKYHK